MSSLGPSVEVFELDLGNHSQRKQLASLVAQVTASKPLLRGVPETAISESFLRACGLLQGLGRRDPAPRLGARVDGELVGFMMAVGAEAATEMGLFGSARREFEEKDAPLHPVWGLYEDATDSMKEPFLDAQLGEAESRDFILSSAIVSFFGSGVRPDWQGRGIFSLLKDKMRTLATERGISFWWGVNQSPITKAADFTRRVARLRLRDVSLPDGNTPLVTGPDAEDLELCVVLFAPPEQVDGRLVQPTFPAPVSVIHSPETLRLWSGYCEVVAGIRYELLSPKDTATFAELTARSFVDGEPLTLGLVLFEEFLNWVRPVIDESVNQGLSFVGKDAATGEIVTGACCEDLGWPIPEDGPAPCEALLQIFEMLESAGKPWRDARSSPPSEERCCTSSWVSR
jgi:GNAT superfamily N-acetyltransferase